jgi:hypothetical protein
MLHRDKLRCRHVASSGCSNEKFHQRIFPKRGPSIAAVKTAGFFSAVFGVGAV